MGFSYHSQTIIPPFMSCCNSLLSAVTIWQSWEWAGNWRFPSHKTCGQLTVSGVNQVLKRLKKRAGVSGRAILMPSGMGLPKTT
jgi:hypothetical protein